MIFDTEHLHYWIQAIRQSPNPMRTMDAFWSGQLKSKEWLIDNIKPFTVDNVSIDIHGGWVGVLASMIFQSGISCRYINSIDIDPICEPIASMMNKKEECDGKFSAKTADMCDVISYADIVINTSCEHISQQQYDRWFSKIDRQQLIVLQSNNYEIPEHIRIAKDLTDFKNQCNASVIWEGQLELLHYTRFMLICKKD